MRFLNKKILIIVLLSAVLVSVFSFARINLASAWGSFWAMAQEEDFSESYFFPTYPQRLMYLAAEISQAGDELTALNEGLVSETEKCDCKFALSQCVKKGLGISSSCQAGSQSVFGDPCANREKIDEKRAEITEKNDQISHLRNLLQKEMETGLERELLTLRPEVAQELKSNLTTILEESENIISPSVINLGLLKVKSTGNCSAVCELGPVCGIKACLAVGTGEQKQITLNFRVGVALEDLKLGKIGIKNINLGLPEEIQLPEIEDSAITIPAQEVMISFPQKTLSELEASKILDLSSATIDLSPQLSLNQPEPIKLSCPKLSFLKAPELPSLPQLPEEIKIPSLKIPEVKFCPKLPGLSQIPSIPGIENVGEIIGKFEDEIKKIEEQIKTVTNVVEKNKLNKEAEQLKAESEKIKQGAKIPEVKTPELKIPTPEIPKKFTELKLPEIKSPGIELPQLGLSSSYQCLFGSQEGGTDGSVEATDPRWYFQSFSFLSETCQAFSDMKGLLGLMEKAKDCFDPEKLPKIIPQECDLLWSDHCDTENPGPEPPEICKDIRYSCEFDKETDKKLAAATQCQNLFEQEGKVTPSSCEFSIHSNDKSYVEYSPDFNPVATLKDKCEKLKTSGRNDPPEICKILPLFTGSIGASYLEEYSTSKTSCPAQKIGDFPSGFGGIQLSCPLALPTLPKISFPEIIIPDVKLPEFNIPPFIKIKLPSFIFEDLVLPDLNLCNLDECQSIFPDLDFSLPSLNLPSLSPSLKIPDLDILFKGLPIKIPLPDIKLSIQLPSVLFNLPQLNLGNLLMPELEIPEFSLPKPKITFAFTGIDLSAIFDYIITFILNALGVPDFSLCINFQISSTFLSIVFPDYYISWLDFPEIPAIPFCTDANQFCRNLKSSLAEVINKVKEIEKIFDQFVQTKIQSQLDKLAQTINNEMTKQANFILEEYSQIIRMAVKERMAEVEKNIGAYIDPVDQKLKIPPIIKTLPGRKIDLPISKATDLIGTSISIPWPEDLKKIKLTTPLTYELPTIPLDKLSFQKDIPLKGPGFQSRTLSIDLGNLGGSGDCLSDSPTGGNPLPVSQFKQNLGNIISLKVELQKTSKKIIDILE